MSEAKKTLKNKLPLSRRDSRKWGCFFILLVIIPVMFLFLTGSVIHLQVMYYTLLGWGGFLLGNIMTLEVNLEMMACGLGALALGIYGLHHLLIWVRKDNPWHWQWTMSLTVLMLMLFASSIAMTGLIHQLGWMMREPLTQNESRSLLGYNVSNAKQIFMLLIEYDDEFGAFPNTLADIVEANYIDEELMHQFLFRTVSNGASEPWIYFGEEHNLMTDEDQKLPLLVSPHPIRGKWIVLRKNGSVHSIKPSMLKKEFPLLSELLPNLIGEE